MEILIFGVLDVMALVHHDCEVETGIWSWGKGCILVSSPCGGRYVVRKWRSSDSGILRNNSVTEGQSRDPSNAVVRVDTTLQDEKGWQKTFGISTGWGR